MSVNELAERVSAHYTPAHLMQAFESVLEARANDSGRVTPEDLAPVDQFHFGGAQATIELAALAGLGPDTPVLDIGGGFGGPARILANTYGCPVTVLDLTEAYCDVGEKLTARCGLQDLVSFQQGDGLAIPFADKSFDRVWTQHSSMNIADKQRLYREVHRVLRPGGRLALYEVMSGTATPLHFPVPWAAEASISFLSTPSTMQQLLADTGFCTLVWDDLTDVAAAAMRSQPMTANAPGLHLILGDDFLERAHNMASNFAEDRAALVRAVLERP
jgi:ubiquinone/menaquinone biosynthesis C-methylase UbiE